MIKYLIREDNWKIMYEFFLNQKGLHATDEASLRLFVEAVFCRVRSGCQWRLLHSDYGDWRAIHKQFLLWCKNNIWEKLLHAVQKNPDLEAIMVDATIVRAHACAAGYGKDSQAKEALGRSRGGFTTKIHAAVDSLGNILRFFLTPGQRNEITQAEDLIKGIESKIVIADKGYDSNKFIEHLEKKGCLPVIPSRKNRLVQRAYDTFLYAERHNVECFFGKLKHFRGVFSRFDKSAVAFLGSLNFVGVILWLR